MSFSFSMLTHLFPLAIQMPALRTYFISNLIYQQCKFSFQLICIPSGKNKLSTATIFFFNQKYCDTETDLKALAPWSVLFSEEITNN